MRRQGDERVPHYVRRNETCRLPRRHICLHSVATRKSVKGGQVDKWGLSAMVAWAAEKGRKPKPTCSLFGRPEQLWAAVSAHTRKGARTILWAHNLGYEIRITQALHYLPRMGWSLVAHNMAPRGAWFVWDRDGTRLVMVDVASVFPKLLPEIGKLFGMGRPGGPGFAEGESAKADRAQVGADIVARAVGAYLEWIETADLGNWQFTGAGQAFSAFRHRHMTGKLLVHDEMAALELERRAMWTGRCEAYWHGTFRRETIHEWDFTSAYPSICEQEGLPTKLVGPMPPRYPWRSHLEDGQVAIPAHVRVVTSVPVVPAYVDGRILWPVGEFETVLWSPELKAAVDAGAQVTVVEGWLYRKTPALKGWAQWILGELRKSDSEVPAWRKVILKHWSTALIGRFAMAFPEWEDMATAPKTAVERRTCVDVDEGTTYEIMQVGRSMFRQTAIVEWQHSQPAITGYVMSCMRVKLWACLQALGPQVALYVDTDSILVADGAHELVAAVAETPAGKGLRLKRSWDGFSIYGPRQIVTGNRVRVAGVPVSATRVDTTVFTGQIWESLAASLNTRHHREVVVKDRTWRAKCVDRRRQSDGFGWTSPITVGE